MENNTDINKIKCKIKEIIALSNIKEEIFADNLKRRKIYNIVLPSCAVLLLGSCILINSYQPLIVKKAESNETVKYGQGNTIIEKENIDKSKVFYIKAKSAEKLSFDYEPTIENLYNNSDIVIIGTYNKDEKIYANGVNIYTTTKFNVNKIIKNTTEFNIDSDVVFDREGGVLNLDEYLKNNIMRKEGEFENIKECDRKKYYIIQEHGPGNILDFTATNNNTKQYIIFMNYIEEEEKLMLNSSYYGMREVRNNKVYDYDSSNFIQIKNKDIEQAIN